MSELLTSSTSFASSPATLEEELKRLVKELQTLYVLNPFKKFLFGSVHQVFSTGDKLATQLFGKVLNCNSADEVGCFIQMLELSWVLRRMKRMGLTSLMSAFEGETAENLLSNAMGKLSMFGSSGSEVLPGLGPTFGTSTTASTTSTTTTKEPTPKFINELASSLTSSQIPGPAQVIRNKMIDILAQFMGIDRLQLIQMLLIVRRNQLSRMDTKTQKFLPFLARFLILLLSENKKISQKVDSLLNQDEAYRKSSKPISKEHIVNLIKPF
jgi:hypothetical protein